MVGNTTRLIGRWSMDGAQSDLGSRFRSALDILAIVAGRGDEPGSDETPPAPTPLLLRPAGEDDWLPLLARDHA